MFDLAINLGSQPNALAVMGEALGRAGISIEVLYSDHDHRLILLTDDQTATATVTRGGLPVPGHRSSGGRA